MPDPAPVINTTLSAKLMAVFSNCESACAGRSTQVIARYYCSGRRISTTGHLVESWVSNVKQLRENQSKNSSDSAPGARPEVPDVGVPDVGECVEAVFGCKWSIRILELIRSDITRPGEIERSLTGL